jgi:plastocyanin
LPSQAQQRRLLLRAKGLAAAAALVVALSAAPATGHPGHGPGTVDIGDGTFAPKKLTVAAGDTVIWFWNGPDTNHSVTAEEGQVEQFDSDPDTAPALVRHEKNDGFSYEFTQLGTYRYYCKVHPGTMRGAVEVITPPPADTTRPRLSDLDVRDGRVHFRISEAAFVVATIHRRGSKKELRSRSAFVRKGDRKIKLPLKRLRDGRYRVQLTAEDDAGNKGLRSARFRIARV